MFDLLTNLKPIFDESAKVAFSLFGVDVAWYAVIILSGALLSAFFGYYHYGVRMGISSDIVSEGVALGLLFGLLGARLYYVLFSEWDYTSFLDVINPRSGGLAIHGAMIAIFIFLPLFCKRHKIDLIVLIEIVMPLVLFSQVVGRWGNFMNQEAFGSLIAIKGVDMNSVTSLTDAQLQAQRDFLHNLFIPEFIIDRMYIPYSSASGFTIPGYYHPTFLYESVFNIIGVTFYHIIRRFNKKVLVGDAVSFYLIWYGAVRIFIESLRTDPLMLGNTGIKQAQLISVVMIVCGLLLLIVRRLKKYRIQSCYDALYSEDAYLMLPGHKVKNGKAIVFDCDGTILDTFELIENIVLCTFKEVYPDYPITKEEAHTFFGPYVPETFKKYAKTEEELKLCVDTYNRYAEELTGKYIKTYEGIPQVLSYLKNRGYLIFVASNKISKEVYRGLHICGLGDLVDDVIGVEQMSAPKPNPSCIEMLKEKYDFKEAIMVGDTLTDIETGKNANIKTIGVTWCQTTKETFEHAGCTAIVDNPLQLKEMKKLCK